MDKQQIMPWHHAKVNKSHNLIYCNISMQNSMMIGKLYYAMIININIDIMQTNIMIMHHEIM